MSNVFASATASAAAALPNATESRAATLRSIDAQWAFIAARAAKALGAAYDALDSVPAPRTILGASHKTEVAENASGALVAMSYLAPGRMLANYAGVAEGETLCAMADLNDCEGGCLGGDNGRGQLSFAAGDARRAQLGRTVLLLGAPALFAALLAADCRKLAARAAKIGAAAYVRCDGTSDLGLAAHGDARDAFEALGVRPYDYTKMPGRAANSAGAYACTFSATPRTIKAARAVLSSGGGIAVVVDAKKNAAARGAEIASLAALADLTGARFAEGDASEPLESDGPTIRCLTAKAGSRNAFAALVSSGLVFAGE
jgi:hypothetical protein